MPRIQTAQHPDEPFVSRAFENRIRDSADEHFGVFHPGVEQCFALADVAVDHPDLALEQPGSRHRAEIDHRDIPDQIRRVPLHFFQERTGGAKEAKENNPRFAHDHVRLRRGHHRRRDRDRAIRARLSHGMRRRARPSDFAIPRSGDGREQGEGERDHSGRRRIGEMMYLRAEGEDDEREFAYLTEVDCRDDAGAQTLPHQVERSESGRRSG